MLYINNNKTKMGDPVNDKLIDFIRDRPCLYDPNHCDSNSYQVKEKQWAEIAKKLRVDALFLKKRWKVIRDRYRKECHRINSIPCAEGKSSWRYYKHLSYLEPHLNSRNFISLPKLAKQVLTETKFTPPNADDEFSEYMEVLVSEPEEETNEVRLTPEQTEFEHTRLIEMVKTMPNLYDRNNYNFNSQHLKQAAWENVAKELNCTIGSAKNKFTELSDQFHREFKKVTDRANAVAPYVSSFKYYDQLSFLIDHLNSNQSSSHDMDIVYCNDLAKVNDDDNIKIYQYLKEEGEVSSETTDWINLDDRDFKIIQYIRMNPVLYDKHHPNYKNVPMRNRKWAQLSFELGEDINNLKSRWITIVERYKLYNPLEQNDLNSQKFIETLAFLDQISEAYDSDSASNMNIKYEPESDESLEEYETKPAITSTVNSFSPQTNISPTSSTYQNNNSLSTTKQVAHDANSHVKMFFDSIAAQVEAENLPFLHWSIIQQEVLKVVHQQISSHLEREESIQPPFNVDSTRP